jgi:hypothetical protein
MMKPLLESAMSKVISTLLRHLPVGPLYRLRRGLRHPFQAQEQILRIYLQRSLDTEYSRRYDFRRILRSENLIEAYQQHVPLHEYEAIADDLDRVHQGEPDVLGPGTFRYFTRSAGTTARGKVFPVSEKTLYCNMQLNLAMALNYIAETGDVSIVQGKILALSGVATDDPYVIGARFGDVSSLMADYQYKKRKRLRKRRQALQALPRSVQLITGMDDRMAAIIEHTMDADVRVVGTMPPWMLVLFQRLIATYNERHKTQVTTVGQIWPNLRLLLCGGVALQTYRRLLDEIIGLPEARYLEGYGASEGFFAFQNDLEDPAMLLHPDCGIFYEFVPFDDLGAERPGRFTIDRIQTGLRYVPHITTPSGLWSFCVRDVVRFTSVDPPKLIVSGRTAEMLQDYSEYVIGEEMQAALDVACKATGARVAEYHVCGRPVGPQGPHTHTWILEFETPPADIQELLRHIDEDLQERNNCYRLCRNEKGFGFPEAFAVPQGTFHRWIKNTSGHLDAQTKVPRLREDREVAEGVLELARNAS